MTRARTRFGKVSWSERPYPVELDLPPWTVERNIDLRNWLFGFGAGIRFESPSELRQEHQERLQAALAVYAPG